MVDDQIARGPMARRRRCRLIPNFADRRCDLVALSPDLYLNRELSWLQFNRRVLEEVAESTKPLLERVKFAAIYSANLDEFFMIRVAGVKRKVTAGIMDAGVDGRTPQQLLRDPAGHPAAGAWSMPAW